MYQYFLLDAFSMHDVNKVDMTEKESKINSQVKYSIIRIEIFYDPQKVHDTFTDSPLNINLASSERAVKLLNG